MVKFLKRWNGNFFSRRLALLLIVVLYFLGQALIVFDGHMDGRNHLVWLDGFPIFLGQVTIRFDACKWLSNVHHRSNNFIAPVYGKFPSFLVSILFSGILGRWWELCIFGEIDMNWQCWKALPLTHLLFSWICSASHQPLDRYFFFISSLFLHSFAPQFSP